MKRVLVWDYLIAGMTVLVGTAEAAHLAGVFLGWSFGRCTWLFAGLAGLVCAAGAGLGFLRIRRHGRVQGREPENGGIVWYIPFILVVILQLIFVCTGDTDYRQGDMTVETVSSFLETDGFYRVNPLTGMPYTAGMPLRLEILCLPGLYGFLCRLTGLSVVVMVQRIVPGVMLLLSYAAYGALAESLFPRESHGGRGKERACFMTAVSVLMWAGTYALGMDGFGLLVCGWRGTSLRNGVLLPWLFSLCIRRKWLWTILCMGAEACVVWTLYGCGACLWVTAGMGAAGLLAKRLRSAGESRSPGKKTQKEEELA